MTLEQIISFVLGILIAGEAILLFIGKYLMGKKEDEWKTRFNMNTLLIDIGFGTIIFFNAFEDMPYIMIAIPALLITHAYREFEYFKKDKKSRFIDNPPLLYVNTIKIIGLAGLFFVAL
jgi:hypothetical protein